MVKEAERLGLRLGLGRRGLRVGRRDRARLARRRNEQDQARLGDLPDARPQPGDDRDDRRDDRRAVRRPDGARDRLLRAAGRRGLARAAVRAASCSARASTWRSSARRSPASGSSSRARRSSCRCRTAREGAEADDRAGPGADPDLPGGDRAEQHGAGRRDRRRLDPDLLLPRARRRRSASCSRRAPARAGTLARRVRHRPDGPGVHVRRPRRSRAT